MLRFVPLNWWSLLYDPSDTSKQIWWDMQCILLITFNVSAWCQCLRYNLGPFFLFLLLACCFVFYIHQRLEIWLYTYRQCISFPLYVLNLLAVCLKYIHALYVLKTLYPLTYNLQSWSEFYGKYSVVDHISSFLYATVVLWFFFFSIVW